MKNSKTTVIRTAVGCLSTAGMIYELRKRGVRVVGVDCNPRSAGFYLCDKSYLVPRSDDSRFLKEVLRICDIEKPNAIISGPEEEILVLAKNKNLFKKRNILVLVPGYKTVKKCFDKTKLYKLFEKNNIPFPEIYSLKKIKFPCFIKPRKGRGGRNAFVVNNLKELQIYLKKIKNPIVQDYIKGDEYTIDVFSDLEANPLSIIPRLRLSIESGISVKGKTVYDKEMIDYCEKIVKELKVSGPACIQCIKNKEGIKFIEINPRFGGGSILSIKADPSIILNLIRIIKGEKPIKSKGFKVGLTMLRYYSEIFTEDL